MVNEILDLSEGQRKKLTQMIENQDSIWKQMGYREFYTAEDIEYYKRYRCFHEGDLMSIDSDDDDWIDALIEYVKKYI